MTIALEDRRQGGERRRGTDRRRGGRPRQLGDDPSQLVFRLPARLHDRLVLEAARRDQDVSAVARQLLELALAVAEVYEGGFATENSAGE